MTLADSEQDRIAAAPMHRDPPERSIYEQLIDMIEDAEQADEAGLPVEAVIQLGAARDRLVAYLHEQAN